MNDEMKKTQGRKKSQAKRGGAVSDGRKPCMAFFCNVKPIMVPCQPSRKTAIHRRRKEAARKRRGIEGEQRSEHKRSRKSKKKAGGSR